MIVISDSTPLISLMKVVRLEILESLFGEVFIPEAVFSELTVNPKYAAEAELISNSSVIKVVSVKEKKAVDILRRLRTVKEVRAPYWGGYFELRGEQDKNRVMGAVARGFQV